ncbi:unnamed protein product, partial [Rotaria sp. Silwood1]
AQPKTLLISDIEPGNRYELVCTTEAGLVRYRMGDVVTCTRFLCRSDDLVPLPIDQEEIPRIPLFSIAYRIGSLLDAFGEKTSEQHLMDALQRTSVQWKEQGIPLDIYDFTSYPKLDVFPPHYVLFLELIEEQNSKQEYKISEKNFQLLQTMVDSEIERQLCQTNFNYNNVRKVVDMGCSSSLFVSHKLNRSRSFNLLKNRYNSDSIQNEFILTGWTGIVPRIELVKRLPDCTIKDAVDKIKATDELQNDKSMDKVYIGLERAQSESDITHLVYAYTIESNFYRILNRKLSNLSVSNNLTEYLTAMFIKTNKNHNDKTVDWPLYFTSIILKGVNSVGSPLKCFCGRTYRGLTITQHDLALYKVNSLIIQKTFSSSSKLRSMAEAFAQQPEFGRMPALFIFIMDVTNTLCIDLAGISEYPNEEEVLILPLSIFMVTKIDQTKPNGYIEIELKAFTSEELLESTISQMFSMTTPINLIESTANYLDH